MTKDLNSSRAALLAGGLAAILASTGCLGPLVLVALGFSGAWIGNLTVLEPYHPIFIGAALVAMYSRARPAGSWSSEQFPRSTV
jgi:mercuric ion transport protein